MTRETAFIEHSHIVVRHRGGFARWTNNPADRDENHGAGPGFNINNVRLSNIEYLIKYRYGGPVDTDDGHAYLSVAFNAIAMGRRFRGWSQSTAPLMDWARRWTPLVDPATIIILAEKVVASPRRMSASVVGKLVRLTFAEWKILGIKTIDPFDIPPERVAEVKVNRKRARDKAAARAARRQAGVRPMREIQSTSIRDFCKRHGLSERTFRHNAAQGADRLRTWLNKKGINPKLPRDVETLERVFDLISRRGAAT